MKSMQCLMAAMALCGSTMAFADPNDGTDSDLSCGTNLVSVGQAKFDVLSWCGEPNSKEGDQWIYQPDPENPPTVVHFAADDTVDRITLLDAD